MQAVAKFGSAAERGALVEEVLPRLVDLAKNPYGHFLICKLLASATKQTLAGECRSRITHLRDGVHDLLGARVAAKLRQVLLTLSRAGSGASARDESYILRYLAEPLQQQKRLRKTMSLRLRNEMKRGVDRGL